MTETRTKVPEPRTQVRRVKEYHPPLGDRGGLRLDFNENTVACSPKVLETLGRISRAELTKYPEREPVERLVADHLKLAPAQVLLTNGVDEAIHVLCQTYLGEGDEMLLPVPTYSMYAVYASSTDARLIEIPAEGNFRFPLAAMLGAITPATKLIAIANPNSPTGQTVEREVILKIAEAAPQSMVLVDEAYFHFYGQSVMDLVGHVPNVTVTRTFSKAYGLAGLRMGVLAAGEEQMRWMRRMISPYSVNSLALACATAALADEEYVSEYVREILAAREFFMAQLEWLRVPCWPSQANFILTRIGAKHGEFSAAMHRRGVLVRDRSSDPGCDGCVRITIGNREQMSSCVKAMVESLAEIGWTGDKA